MGKRIAGVAVVVVDGNPLPLKGGWTVSPSRFERAGIAGQDRVHGYSENPRVPFMEGDFSTTAEVSVADLDDISNSTVTTTLANGKTYVLQEAWSKGAFEVNSKDGQFRIRFEGVECYEMSA